MNKDPDPSPGDDALDRALARWEWEGGHNAASAEEHTAPKRKEKRMLQFAKTATHD